MKKLCFILLIIVSMIFGGCGTKKETVSNTTTNTQSNSNYDITKASYEDKEIKISYPQIEKMSDSNKQKKINEIIKTEVLKVTNDYKEDIDKLNLKLDYEISFKGSDVISIKYLGNAYVKETAHPNNIICTTNINIDKSSILKLSDVVTIDDSFVKKFKSGKYKNWSADLNLETAGELKNVLGSLDNQGLIEQFKEKTAKFYFTKDSLGVSVEVPHAVGDHMELEIAYKDLGSLLLIKPAGIEISKSSDSPKNTENAANNTNANTQSKSSSEKTLEKPNKTDNIPALELVKALCLSQVLHYDSFTSEPDKITTTYTLYNLVKAGNFRWHDILKVQDGAYYFSNGSESEAVDNKNNTYVSPNQLYQDYFVTGKYKYPPDQLNSLIEGTQTGIAVHLSDLPYGVEVKVKSVEQKDDKAIITVTISRTFQDDRKPEVLGDAVITLKEAVNSCYFEYKIVSYEPKYDKFKDIELK